MATFTVTVTNPAHIAGITAARNAYNQALSLSPAQGVEGEENYVPAQEVEDHPDYIDSDEAYIQFVVGRAAESYARQYA